MGTLSIPVTLVPGTNENISDVKTNFDAVAATVNSLDDSNISAAAGIQASKLAAGVTGLAQGTFKSYRNAASSLATGAVVPFDAEEFDVSGWHDVTTNVGRYTPLVAGYYQFSAHVFLGVTGTGSQWMSIALYKNGAQHAQFGTVMLGGTVTMQTGGGAPIALANGTTDYFTVVLNHNFGSAQALTTGVGSTWFAGHLIGRS